MRLHCLASCLVSNDDSGAPELLNAITGTYEAISPILEESFEILAIRNACPITAAAFLNIVADLFAMLVLSSSESLARHACRILMIIAGEKTESFLLPVSATEQKNIAKNPAFALQNTSSRRCITLTNYVHALKSRPRRHESPESLRQFSETDIDALQIVDMALQNMSDENDLAILRSCSARELRLASEITDIPIKTVGKNRRQSDFTLALQGYALGEKYTFDATNIEVQAWVCLLSEAGVEHSVSSSRWCVDELLTVDARIFARGQQQSFQ